MARRYLFVVTILFMAFILLLSGCTLFGTRRPIEKTAEELAAEGLDAFNRQRYSKSIESFQKLKDWYPFSRYAILAELKIADARFHLKQFDLAFVAYQEFENLHPRNEAIPYVLLQMGLCWFRQIPTIDRDQTPAWRALEMFQRLTREYPRDDHALRAWPYIQAAQRSIAAHELYVGEFYYKKRRYAAAAARFRTILTDYPDAGLHYQALLQLLASEARRAASPVD